MDLFDKIIDFLVCWFEIFILFDYFKNFFDVKLEKRYTKFIFVGTVFILFLINNIQNSIINLILVPLLLWIFVTILFDAKLGIRIGYFIIAYAVMIGVEFLYIILSETTADMLRRTGLIPVSEYIWQLLVIKFLNYIVFLILKQSSVKSKKKMINKLFISYLCVPVTTIGTMLAVFYSGINIDENLVLKYVMTFFFICMIAGNVLFFYAFQRYTENLEESNYQKMELIYQKSEIERLTQIAQIDDSYKEVLHNATHYLKVIGELAYENRKEEICEIVESLIGKISISRDNIYEYSHRKC